jgi:hypothetical protein
VGVTGDDDLTDPTDDEIEAIIDAAVAEGEKVTPEEHRVFMARMSEAFLRRAVHAGLRGDTELAGSLTRLAIVATEEAHATVDSGDQHASTCPFDHASCAAADCLCTCHRSKAREG